MSDGQADYEAAHRPEMPLPTHTMLRDPKYVEMISMLCQHAHEIARSKGFHSFGEKQRGRICSDQWAAPPTYVRADLAEFDTRMALSMLALVHSEVSEIVEAVRKPEPGHHIGPEFTQEEEEAADVLIRMFDYSHERGLRLGAAVLAKMRFNESRPHMHGKAA